MSKVKLLLDVVEDLRNLADSVNAVAQAIAENEQPKNPDEVTKQPQPIPAEEPQPIPAEEPQPIPAEEPQPSSAEEPQEAKQPEESAEKALTQAQVRTILEEKCNQGWRPVVFALIAKYAPKLSEMDPKDYPALLRDVEEKCHGSK